jgi:hypothetical protein
MGKWEDLFGKLGRAFLRGASRGRLERSFAPRPRGASFAGQAARAAFRLFKDNCVQLPWVEEGAALDATLDGARADLLRSWNVYRSSLAARRRAALVEGDWQHVLTDFRRHVADLNRRIAAYNLKVPSAGFRRAPVDAEQEINRVMTTTAPVRFRVRP